MNKVQFSGRPLIHFDPDNSDHRKWFFEFTQFNTWGRCPVRFIIDDDVGDLITMVQRKLISHYLTKEFQL